MYRKILVPLDGSELSESILSHVANVSLGCKVPNVTLLRVREAMDKDVRKALDADIAEKLDGVNRQEVLDYLKQVAATLKEKGVTAKTAVVAGEPAEEILKYATANKTDLIIMSTHGRTGLSRWAFGSVADKILHHSNVPVLIGPPPGVRNNS